MKALVKTAPTVVELQTLKEPEIQQSDEVKVKIAYCSFCRDDMWPDELSVFGGHGIMGHEASGVIVQSGEKAAILGFRPGERVAVNPLKSCGYCKSCLTQHEQYCPEIHVSAGLMAEYVVKDYTQLIQLPDDLSFPQANLMEPVGGVVESLGKLRIDFSSEILLIGGGFTGLVFIRLLRLRGAKQITVIEPVQARRNMALEYGADNVFDPEEPDLQMKLLANTDFNGFDNVIDTSAKPEMIEFGLACLIKGGTMLNFAYRDSQSKLSLSYFNMYVNNATLIWSCMCGRKSMALAAELIKRFEFQKLITRKYPLSQAVHAFERYLGTGEIKIGVEMTTPV